MLICMNTFSTIKSKQQAENYFSEELRQYFDGSNIKGRLIEVSDLQRIFRQKKFLRPYLITSTP